MIEHPDYMRQHAVEHLEALIQQAENVRRIREIEAQEPHTSWVTSLNNLVAELKFWGKGTRRAATRA